MVGKCVPVYSRGGVVQISDNKTIDTKLQGGRLPILISDRLLLINGGKENGTNKTRRNILRQFMPGYGF